jgi:cell volume regulation protein A
VLSLPAGLLLGSGLLLVALLAVRLSYRIGLPGLLLYLGIGLVVGIGTTVSPQGVRVERELGLLALVVILAEGGLTTRLSDVRPVLGVSAALGTIGVLASVAVVALVARPVFGDWRSAILMGAIVSSTDAAAVFSVLRRLRLRRRISAVLEAESGLNDAPAVVIVGLAASDQWGHRAWWVLVLLLVGELLGGLALGLLTGFVARGLLGRIALPAVGLYPLAVLAFILAAYSGATLLHVSGLLSGYVCALIVGSSRLPHRRAVLGFVEGLAWLAQIGLFVALGVLAEPQRLMGAVLPALAIGGVLLLVARPVAVAVSATWFRVRWREQAFLSWAGLRGAVPIVFATVPLSRAIPHAARIFDTTVVLVLILTLLQGPTLPWVARRLGVASDAEAGEVGIETAPLDEMNAELLEMDVVAGSGMVGCYVTDLSLPGGADVVLLVRDGRSAAPNPETRLRAPRGVEGRRTSRDGAPTARGVATWPPGGLVRRARRPRLVTAPSATRRASTACPGGRPLIDVRRGRRGPRRSPRTCRPAAGRHRGGRTRRRGRGPGPVRRWRRAGTPPAHRWTTSRRSTHPVRVSRVRGPQGSAPPATAPGRGRPSRARP